MTSEVEAHVLARYEIKKRIGKGVWLRNILKLIFNF